MTLKVDLKKETRFSKHSGVGIASFVISIIAGIIIWGCIIIGGYLEATTIGGLPEESGTIVVIGLLVILGLFLCLIGTGLGIYGVIQKNRRRIFSVIALVLNVTMILLTIFLILLGNME